jgi:hypothetical protein
MAHYTVSCAEATLTMDTDAGNIVIKRSGRNGLNLPALSEFRLADIAAVEHQYTSFMPGKGTGTIKFVYPGCPEGGDMLMGFTTHENMVQYKGNRKADADALLAALMPIVEANKASSAS